MVLKDRKLNELKGKSYPNGAGGGTDHADGEAEAGHGDDQLVGPHREGDLGRGGDFWEVLGIEEED